MTSFIIAAVLVVGIIAGGLFTLLRSKHAPMPSPEVLDRVRQRNRELDAQERREQED